MKKKKEKKEIIKNIINLSIIDVQNLLKQFISSPPEEIPGKRASLMKKTLLISLTSYFW